MLKVTRRDGKRRTMNDVLKLFFKKLLELYLLGIKPIFVFDGSVPSLKRKKLTERKSKTDSLIGRAESIKMKIAKEAMIEHALSLPHQPSLEMLKNINKQHDDFDSMKWKGELKIKKLKDFYFIKDFKLVDVDSEEFKKLTHQQKYEYLVFLHDLVKYQFDEEPSYHKLSLKQVDKMVLLGKINKKFDELYKRKGGVSKLKYIGQSHNFNESASGHRVFSSDNQYYFFLKETGLIKNEPEELPTETSLLNPKANFHSLSFSTKKNFKKPSLELTPPPLSSESNDESSSPIISLHQWSNEKTEQKDAVSSPIANVKTVQPSSPPLPPIENSSSICEIPQILLKDIRKLPQSNKSEKLLKSLYSQFSTISSQAATVPKELFLDCCLLISLFGFGFLVAPGEAEAQCAVLQQLGLCHLVATEDSDSLLFGACKIIRGLFSIGSAQPSSLRSAHVDLYDSNCIKHILGLTQDLLICIGMISGCDYDDGIKGLGIVSAYKLISDFYNPDPMLILLRIKEFLKNNEKTKFIPPENFPSESVFKCFQNPLTNRSTQPFGFKKPNIDLLRDYFVNKINLSHSEVENAVKTLLNVSHSNEKKSLDHDIDPDAIISLYTKSVKEARKKLISKLQN